MVKQVSVQFWVENLVSLFFAWREGEEGEEGRNGGRRGQRGGKG